ncbi:hypothetical protein KAT92_02650 [Candidatus Babeliales bacterium]|nr:hypothetical protein [Candidatus Babeliales bacterium]
MDPKKVILFLGLACSSGLMVAMEDSSSCADVSSAEIAPEKTRRTDFSNSPEENGLRLACAESRTASFNEMVVRHAKRLCNGGFSKVFSQDGRDFISFWDTANDVNLDIEKAYTCMRLFSNNIKSTELIDHTVATQILAPMPQFLGKYFEKDTAKKSELSLIRENIEDMLLGQFTDKLDTFQTQPDLFISKLSSDVVNLVKSRLTIIKQEDEEQDFREKLRAITIRFIDTTLNKLIWYEDSYQSVWQSVITIGDQLHTLGFRGILDDQDSLDELWDSLVRRFVWFLDFKGSLLPVEFYEQIEEDLKNNVVFFLEVEEQDEGIKSKKEMIAEAIVKAKAKAIALEQNGLFTDQAVNS